MKKQLPARAGCLLLLALTIFAAYKVWLPITEDTGERSQQILEGATASDTRISLDFNQMRRYRIPRTAATEPLLDEAAIGQTYEVTARYHSGRSTHSKYYEVLALTCADGTVYYTWEDAEAARQASMPLRLGLLVILDVAGCALLIWRERKINQRKKEATP